MSSFICNSSLAFSLTTKATSFWDTNTDRTLAPQLSLSTTNPAVAFAADNDDRARLRGSTARVLALGVALTPATLAGAWTGRTITGRIFALVEVGLVAAGLIFVLRL
jgi:hypothetical protein